MREEGMSVKTNPGNFFEDFRLGQEIVHATPRTVTEGDVALYTSLYGNRFALTSSTPFAQTLGLERAPLDSLLVFHIVFGKTVPDISLNAIANLGYGGRAFRGDCLSRRHPFNNIDRHRVAPEQRRQDRRGLCAFGRGQSAQRDGA
jgi:hypothetical protein